MYHIFATVAIFGLSAASMGFMLFVLASMTRELKSRKRRRQL
jgi:hypothetical protein